jgi:flagellar biosynthesis protein FliR
MSSIISKADLRSVTIIAFVALFIGSFIYFVITVPFDEEKKLDPTLMVLLMMNLLIGTLVGMFAWLGFKQGQAQPQNTN